MQSSPREKKGKLTIRALAKELGMSLGDVAAAKEDGLNPYDREAMKKWKSQRNSYGSNSEPQSPPDPDAERLTLEQIEERASMAGQSKKDIEVYKVQLEVMKAAAALRVQRNLTLSRAEVDERDAKIGHAMQAMLRKIENEVPALLFGKSSLGEMKEITKTKVRECQSIYADGMSEFWEARPEI